MITTTIGMFWGDEGKAKIVDYLSPGHRIVARFNGGANAGHTVVVNGGRQKVHQLPPGIWNPDVWNVIGNGCVVSPEALVQEAERVAEILDMKPQDLKVLISERAHVVTIRHRDLDIATETANGNRLGTTRQGIGFAYADKALRTGIRLGDVHRMGELHPSVSSAITTLSVWGWIEDTTKWLNDCIDAGHRILRAGAHGSLLDIDHGHYPYVTSSNCTIGGAITGTGLAPRPDDVVVGIAKAYVTRVAPGPMRSEIHDEEVASKLRERGQEYGTTTGRARRIGWIDVDALRYSCMLNRPTYLALTMLDVLSAVDTVNIFHGRASTEHASWPDISQVRTWQDLPEEARNFVNNIEDRSSTRVALISVGPGREQIIDRRVDLGLR